MIEDLLSCNSIQELRKKTIYLINENTSLVVQNPCDIHLQDYFNSLTKIFNYTNTEKNIEDIIIKIKQLCSKI